MVAAVEVYAFVVAMVFLAFLAAALRYERSAVKRRFERRLGVSWRWGMRAALLALVAIGVLLVVGSLPTGGGAFAHRRHALAVALPSASLVGGSVLLAAAAGNARTVRSLLESETTTTGVGVVSGVAASVETPGSTPFTGREALCWRWRAEVYDPNGAEAVVNHSRLWEPRDVGTGGVPFRVETGGGSVRVDPTGGEPETATGEWILDLAGERTVRCDGDEALGDAPERVRDVEREYGSKPRRYVESRLAPGRAVTVRGRIEDGTDGRVVRAGEHVPLRIVSGTRRAALRRYGFRSVAFLAAGALAVWLGATWLAAVLGVV